MAKYQSYEAVKAVQAWLETAKDAGAFVFEGTLKKSVDADPFETDSYDGKWGPETDRVFNIWLAGQPEGSSIDTMVEYDIITAAEARTVKQAMSEYAAGGVREPPTPPPEPKPTQTLRTDVQRAGFSSGWILAGLAVGGLLVWAIMRPKQTTATSMARWR